MRLELNRANIVARLETGGWISEGGTKHEKFHNSAKPGVKIMDPRHKALTPGVARNIANAAGW